jgi:hypothetical protein
MTLPKTERRLCAILAADVVGYSRLIEEYCAPDKGLSDGPR